MNVNERGIYKIKVNENKSYDPKLWIDSPGYTAYGLVKEFITWHESKAKKEGKKNGKKK